MTLSLEMQDELLIATLSGEISEPEAALRIKEVLEFVGRSRAAVKNVKKILANCLAVTGRLSTMERYSLALAAVSLGRSLEINPNIAFVGRPPTFDGFALRVAINRGSKSAMFTEIQPALDWLTHTA